MIFFVLKVTYTNLKNKYEKLLRDHKDLLHDHESARTYVGRLEQELQRLRNMYREAYHAGARQERENKALAQHIAQLQRRGLNTQSKPSQFTEKEIKHLIFLCHPDKHHGSQLANDLTVKLIKLR